MKDVEGSIVLVVSAAVAWFVDLVGSSLFSFRAFCELNLVE